MTQKEINKLQELIKRTENNINFYIEEDKCMHLLNEIGVLRGLIYAKEISEKELNIDEWQREIFKLQVNLTDIDEELKKI